MSKTPSARKRLPTGTARSTACRWKTPARSRASPPRWTPPSPRSSWRRRPAPICSSSITACFGPDCAVDGRAPRDAGVAHQKQSGRVQFPSAAGRPSAPGQQRAICAALGFKNLKPFFFEKGRFIGWQTRQKISRRELSEKLAENLGRPPVLLPGGPAQCRRIGVVTGGAGGRIENRGWRRRGHIHHRRRPALDPCAGRGCRIECILRRPLRHRDIWRQGPGRRSVKKFRVPWSFLDHPSGL